MFNLLNEINKIKLWFHFIIYNQTLLKKWINETNLLLNILTLQTYLTFYLKIYSHFIISWLPLNPASCIVRFNFDEIDSLGNGVNKSNFLFFSDNGKSEYTYE